MVPQQVNTVRQDPWGFQPAAYTARKTEVMALASLLCAVASFALLPLIPAVAAIILGYAARDRIRRSKGMLEGEGLATAGIVIGIINVVLVLGLLTAIVVVSLYEAVLLFPLI
jgi:cytochrome c biogenesis protein CcdA